MPADRPAPLLVGFHQFSASHLDIFVNTTFPQEASARGWYLLGPLSGSQGNFSSIESQINTKYVIEWVLENFLVDEGRIYGVGFSMGGGSVTNFAARHVDPGGPMFAALCNHTGSVSVHDSYINANPQGRTILESIFGGSPTRNLFAYQRSSVIDLDPVTGEVVPGADLARNLTHVPLRNFYAHGGPDRSPPGSDRQAPGSHALAGRP